MGRTRTNQKVIQHAVLTSTYRNGFDMTSTLRGLEPIRGSERAAQRIARSVSIVLGIALFAPMAHANTGSIEQFKYDPKRYINATMSKKEARCLRLLIGKESAWNYKAIGNLNSPTKSYVYGLLQIKNPIAKDMNPMQQIQLHMRYLEHRYSGSSCKAWKHWQDKGWH